MKALIQKLVESIGPSGYESSVRDLVKSEIGASASQFEVDALGNLIVRVGKKSAGGLMVNAWRVDLQLDDFDPSKDVTPIALSPKVIAFNCRMLDKDQPEKDDEPNWQDEWSTSNCIPKAVEITLYMKPVKEGGDPLEVKRVVEIPMFDLSQNPRKKSSSATGSSSGGGVKTSSGGIKTPTSGGGGINLPPGGGGVRMPR